LAAIGALAESPRPPGCVRLQGPDGFYRVRIGDYRIVYLIEDRVLLVCVIRIAHRKDVYRGP
jgi:mRNA interferase RelE/StbE